MSTVQACRQALETALNGMSPALPTAWPNKPYQPETGTAFQKADVLFSKPRSMEQSGKLHEERGFMQSLLFYPLGTGPAAAEARAELIRATFYRGAQFTASGVTVFVENTPEIAPPLDNDDWYVVPVRVPFYAHITRTA